MASNTSSNAGPAEGRSPTQPCIFLLGKTNSGKSAIFNTLAGRAVSTEGSDGMPTTGINTDKVIETDLITEYGPVKLLDTMGFDGTNDCEIFMSLMDHVTSHRYFVAGCIVVHNCCGGHDKSYEDYVNATCSALGKPYKESVLLVFNQVRGNADLGVIKGMYTSQLGDPDELQIPMYTIEPEASLWQHEEGPGIRERILHKCTSVLGRGKWPTMQIEDELKRNGGNFSETSFTKALTASENKHLKVLKDQIAHMQTQQNMHNAKQQEYIRRLELKLTALLKRTDIVRASREDKCSEYMHRQQAPHGYQHDSGDYWCCIVHCAEGNVPGKTNGREAWYPYGGEEHYTADRDDFTILTGNNTSQNPQCRAHGNQDDSGDYWCCIVHCAEGDVPGKANDQGEAWYSHGGQEKYIRCDSGGDFVYAC